MPNSHRHTAPAAPPAPAHIAATRVEDDSDSSSKQQVKKKPKNAQKTSSTGATAQEEEGEDHVEMTESAESTSFCSQTAMAYSSGNALNHLLRHPLPNVLADMVTDYLFHPQFDLWEEIISVYESLPHTLRTGDKTTKQELMPKSELSPPASPMEVDELEQQFQFKYGDPNFISHPN